MKKFPPESDSSVRYVSDSARNGGVEKISHYKEDFDMSKLTRNGVFDAENSNILTENFDALFTEAVDYKLPMGNVLAPGSYESKIDQVEPVCNDDGTLNALSFCHTLKDGDGNVYHVRFRNFVKGKGVTVMDLAKIFKGYGIKKFENSVGIEEDVVVSPKENSEYLVISSRKMKRKGTGGLLSSKRKPITVAPPDDDPEYDDFLEEDYE